MTTRAQVPEIGEFKGFNKLARIDEHNTSPQQLKWLWEKMSECEEVWDDHTRGKVDYFLAQFANPDVEFYKIGDSGLIVLDSISERGGSRIHYVIWDHNLNLHTQKTQAVEIFDYLFWKRRVHHIVGMIPSHNQQTVRFAVSVGMKYEGEIREDVLYNGKYYNTHIYGILESEYPSRRARMI
jgi:RimJ/RimL family protein N-acetyltransferase